MFESICLMKDVWRSLKHFEVEDKCLRAKRNRTFPMESPACNEDERESMVCSGVGRLLIGDSR